MGEIFNIADFRNEKKQTPKVEKVGDTKEKILFGNFGKNKIVENSDVKEEEKEYEDLTIEHINAFTQFKDSGDSERLMNMNKSVLLNEYLKIYAEMKKYTNDQLINWLGKKHKKEWKKKPVFFMVIFLEMEARIKRENNKRRLYEKI